MLSYFSYREKTYKKYVIKNNFWLTIMPFVIFSIYTLIIWGIGSNAEFENFIKLCSTLLYLILAYGYACTAFYLFKAEGIDFIFWSGVISYMSGSVFYLIVSYGLNGLISYIKSLITGETNTANFAMEVHDLTFAMGVFFLYYVFFENKNTKKHKIKIIVSLILIFMGLKRIELLALSGAILVYYVLLKWGKKIQIRALVCTICATVISLVFIYIIDTGILALLMSNLGITDDGARLSFYLYSSKFYELGLGYVGTGWTWFSKYFFNLYLSHFRLNGGRIAASLHSDILTIYIEVGCIVFIIWMFWLFFVKPIRLTKKFGLKTGECVLLLTIYMFILYLTDNTLTYPDTQMIFLLVPMIVSWVDNQQRISE
ncbi:hypothetical protein NNG62_10720 [Enterococcus faecium]|nr:hypothetical protein [Enterococcus faecium]